MLFKKVLVVTLLLVSVTLYSCQKDALKRADSVENTGQRPLKGLYAVYERDSPSQVSFCDSLYAYAYIGSGVLIIGCAVTESAFLNNIESVISDKSQEKFGSAGYWVKCEAEIKSDEISYSLHGKHASLKRLADGRVGNDKVILSILRNI